MSVYHSMYVEVRIVELVFFLHLYMGPEIEIISPGLGGQLSLRQCMLVTQGKGCVCGMCVCVCICAVIQ